MEVQIMNSLRGRAKEVAGRSKDVTINPENVMRFCKYFDSAKVKHWLSSSPFPLEKLSIDERLFFVFVFNSISFSYWGEPKWSVDYNGYRYDGSYGMLASLGRALEEGKLVSKAGYLAEISDKNFQGILAGNAEIPLFAERLAILRELGQAVEQKYLGAIRNMLEESKYNALALLNTIIREFPSFRDVSLHDGEQIGFFKRAQLLVADIEHIVQNLPSLRLTGMGETTACADYKLPQVLRRHGIVEYSPELAGLVDSKTQLQHGSRWEVEIRAATVHTVELVRENLTIAYPWITSAKVNDYLWLEGQIKMPGDKPYHRTRTTKY